MNRLPVAQVGRRTSRFWAAIPVARVLLFLLACLCACDDTAVDARGPVIPEAKGAIQGVAWEPPKKEPEQKAQEFDIEQSVVLIRCVQQDFDYITPWKQTSMVQGVGSGFIIEGNKILTNAHNVSNIKYVEVKKQNFARRYPAMVEFIGHDCDLAVISVFDRSFFKGTRPLEFGGIPKVNSTVSTYGFPIGGQHISVTEGVVSRVQMDVYSHTGADSHLVIQTDAAINPGNSGGPVIQNGKVVGVAFQGIRIAENIGYMIPTTVVEHFLDDVRDGRYDSYGSLGFSYFKGLHNPAYKDYLKVPEDEDGVVVLGTTMHSSAEKVLRVGDVITRLDDYNVDNDGMVRIYGLTLSLGEVIERKQIGEIVEVTFYRDGEMKREEVTVALNRPVLEYARSFDEPPDYEVFAGLTFVPLTRNYLENWGRSWLGDVPFYLRYLFVYSQELNTDRELKGYVVLSEVMPDKVNSYCNSFKNRVVQSINGTTIYSLDDVADACRDSKDGFCVVQFMGTELPLILDASLALQRHGPILEKYEIPTNSRTEEQL
jgi:S1-C subfamily serine protease